MDYRDDGHGLPSDFPSDPVYHFHLLAWGLGALLLVLFAAAIIMMFRRAYVTYSRSQREDAIKERVARVDKALRTASQGSRDDQIQKAEAAVAAVDANFAQTLVLSKALNDAMGPLLKALEGVREEDVKPGGMMNGGNVMAGGTVINIAVNNGQPVTPEAAAAAVPGPYASAPAPAVAADGKAAVKEAMSPGERAEAVWKAIHKLYAYWKNKTAVTTAFTAAQQQLLNSPYWEPPQTPDLPPRAGGKRS